MNNGDPTAEAGEVDYMRLWVRGRDRVLALHEPKNDGPNVGFCKACDDERWPCPTVRAVAQAECQAESTPIGGGELLWCVLPAGHGGEHLMPTGKAWSRPSQPAEYWDGCRW